MLLIEKIAEERIQEAIEKGEFKETALKGQPYRMDGYLYENPGERLQMKILRDQNLLPMPLQIKKEVETRQEELNQIMQSFKYQYIRKLDNILNILELRPSYPLNRYTEYPLRHRIFMTRHLPLIVNMRNGSTLQMELFLFNRAIDRKSQQVSHICERLFELIEEYNREIMKATLKKRDLFRNFTTIGTRWVHRKQKEFDRTFPRIMEEQ